MVKLLSYSSQAKGFAEDGNAGRKANPKEAIRQDGLFASGVPARCIQAVVQVKNVYEEAQEIAAMAALAAGIVVLSVAVSAAIAIAAYLFGRVLGLS